MRAAKLIALADPDTLPLRDCAEIIDREMGHSGATRPAPLCAHCGKSVDTNALGNTVAIHLECRDKVSWKPVSSDTPLPEASKDVGLIGQEAQAGPLSAEAFYREWTIKGHEEFCDQDEDVGIHFAEAYARHLKLDQAAPAPEECPSCGKTVTQFNMSVGNICRHAFHKLDHAGNSLCVVSYAKTDGSQPTEGALNSSHGLASVETVGRSDTHSQAAAPESEPPEIRLLREHDRMGWRGHEVIWEMIEGKPYQPHSSKASVGMATSAVDNLIRRLADSEREIKYANSALGGNQAVHLADRIVSLKQRLADSETLIGRLREDLQRKSEALMKIISYAATAMSYKPYSSTSEMREELRHWVPSWGNQIVTRGVIYACEMLETIAASLEKPKRKHRLSAWNRFFSTGRKAGKSPKQIAEEWKARGRDPSPSGTSRSNRSADRREARSKEK
jgi:hypothetical protein